jgi:hypothetical protein
MVKTRKAHRGNGVDYFDTYLLGEISSLRRIRQPPVHYSA